VRFADKRTDETGSCSPRCRTTQRLTRASTAAARPAARLRREIARASCVAAFSPAERAALHGALDDPDRTNVPARRLAFRQARPNDIHGKI